MPRETGLGANREPVKCWQCCLDVEVGQAAWDFRDGAVRWWCSSCTREAHTGRRLPLPPRRGQLELFPPAPARNSGSLGPCGCGGVDINCPRCRRIARRNARVG